MNWTRQLLENWKYVRCTLLLKKTFGMQIIKKYNKGVGFLSWLLIFLVNMLAIPLKDKKSIRITDTFQKTLSWYKYKRNKIWLDTGN